MPIGVPTNPFSENLSLDGDVQVDAFSHISRIVNMPAASFEPVAAKTVFVNPTNATAVPIFMAGTAAFQYLRVNSTNTGLEWAILSVASPITLTSGTIGFDQTVNLNNNARVGVRKNSTGSTFLRRRLNLIEGSNVTITVADDSTDEEVDITIASTGGGGSQGWDDTLAIDFHSGANNPHIDTGQYLSFKNADALPSAGDIRSSLGLEIEAVGDILLHTPFNIVLSSHSGAADSVQLNADFFRVTTGGNERFEITVDGTWEVTGASGTSGQYIRSSGAGGTPQWSTITISELGAIAAKSVVANATNASAVPTALAGSAAFQYLRVNSANNALEWATLSGHASTSITYTSDQFQRAALTGAIVASANSNATLFAGIRDNDAAENDRTNLNFLSTSTAQFVVTDDAGNDELEITVNVLGVPSGVVNPTNLQIFGTPTNTGVPFIIYVSFAAGGGGAADDVTVFNASAPFAFRILESWLVTLTPAGALPSVQARTATGGAGSALSTPMSAIVAGKTSDNSTATATVAASGSMFLRRTDSGIAGEFFAMCVRT